MIKITKGERTVRETSAPYEYKDGDELKTETIRVLYYSRTTADERKIRERMEKARADSVTIWATEILAEEIHSLPDLADGNGKPIPITVDFLDGLDVKNIKAIEKAIREDADPK